MGRFSTTPLIDATDGVERAVALHQRAAVLVERGLLPADYNQQCKTLADVRKVVESAELAEKETQAVKSGLSKGLARFIVKPVKTADVKPWNLKADKERNRDFILSSPKNF